MDNPKVIIYVLIAFVIGVGVGIMIYHHAALSIINTFGTAIKVENMNVTLSINETALIDYINQTKVP